MARVYRLQRLGRAIYLALPKFLVTEEMLLKGVITEILHVDKGEIIMKVRVAGEHIKNNKTGGGNTQKSRAACGVRKVD